MSVIEKFLEIVKIRREKGLKTGLPPQMQDPKMIKRLLNELLKHGVKEDDLAMKIMEIWKEYVGILEGKVDDYIVQAIEMLLENSSDPNAWCHLATMLKRKGDLAEARICFERALSLAPNHSDANYNYGNLLREQGDLKGAEQRYRKCIGIDPKDFNAHNNLGDILLMTDRLDEAEQEFKEVIEIFPLHPKAYNNLGAAYFRREDYDRSEEYFRKAIEIDPDYQKAKENLSQLLAVKSLQKLKGDGYYPQDFQVFGKAEIIKDGIKIGSAMTDGSELFVVGGVNIKVKNLEKYKNFGFDLEYEDGGGILEMAYLESESSPPLHVLPFLLADFYGKMSISGLHQPGNGKEIDLNKVKLIRFTVRCIFPVQYESLSVWIRNFKLFK